MDPVQAMRMRWWLLIGGTVAPLVTGRVAAVIVRQRPAFHPVNETVLA